ncbi:hypothetical protein BGZ83_008387, partial [Gryganskiella cystojenkinii]
MSRAQLHYGAVEDDQFQRSMAQIRESSGLVHRQQSQREIERAIQASRQEYEREQRSRNSSGFVQRQDSDMALIRESSGV